MNVLDWTGPEFLGLFVPLCLAGLGAAILLRCLLTGPFSAGDVKAKELQPYEVAYLAGGAWRTVQAAIASLVHSNHLIVDATKNHLFKTDEKLSDKRPELEIAIFEEIDDRDGTPIRSASRLAVSTMDDLRHELLSMGLILPRWKRLLARFAPVMPLGLILILGLAKIDVGMRRLRPVGNLTFLCLVLAIVCLVFLVLRTNLTRRGRRLLWQVRDRSAALQYTVKSAPQNLGRRDLILAVSLFGVGILSAGPLADYSRVFGSAQQSGWWSSGGSSSCGASSCGGNGGCGGGGGGGCGGAGGGCGGCGGGGN